MNILLKFAASYGELTPLCGIKNAVDASKYGADGFCRKSEDITWFTKIIKEIEQK